MSKLSMSDLISARDAAQEVIDSLAGRGEVSKDDNSGMIQLWDFLNDKAAPPEVVKAMADEIINLRNINADLYRLRVQDRRAFSNPAAEDILTAEIKQTLKLVEK